MKKYDIQWLILNERGQQPGTPSNIYRLHMRCVVRGYMVSCLLKIGQQTTGFPARMVETILTVADAKSVARDRVL